MKIIKALEKTNNPIKRWFAGRLETRIDRLWLGGVMLINAAVWLLFGAQYVATSLVFYFFVFMLVFRHRIKELFLPGDYYLVYNFDGCRIDWVHGKVGCGVFIPFLLLLMYTGHAGPIEYGLSFAIVPLNILFIFAYKAMFRAYRADCAVHDVRECTNGWYGWCDTKTPRFLIRCYQALTPGGAVLLMMVLFVITFYSYAVGDYSPFGMFGWDRGKRLFIVFWHVTYNYILFGIACSILVGITTTLEKNHDFKH